MGSLVPDGEVEEPFIREAIFEKVVDTVNVDFLFHLQLVIIREVEGHRHVGLPHAALHVVHGKGVGGAFIIFDGVALVVEINLFVFVVAALIGNRLFGFIVFTVRIAQIVRIVSCRSTYFHLADIGRYGVFVAACTEFQQTGSLTMRTANIQYQLTINKDPYVIVAREEEFDGNIFAVITFNLTVFR